MKFLLQVLIAVTVLFLCPATSIAQRTHVLIKTTKGNIVVRLFNDVPMHQANFIKLAKCGQLDSTLFHRVIQNFMIQGGDPDSKYSKPDTTYGEGDLQYKVPSEFMPKRHFHKKGALAAARDDNPAKASSACQFYIVQGKVFTKEKLDTLAQKKNLTITRAMRKAYTTVGGTPHLDGNYTVFGRVVLGMNVVDSIAAQPTNKVYGDRPIEDIRILSVSIISQPLWMYRLF
jgi:cyclophilin family peptidyl-prolyl cis-trans isomerase